MAMAQIRRRSISGVVCLCTVAVLLQLALVVSSCGGGNGGAGSGGSGSQPPPPAADFSLSANPASVSIPAGMTTSTMVTATPINGFSSTVSVQLTGLPSGVTASPANFQLIPGSPETVELSAAASAPVNSVTAELTATSGTLNRIANLGVAVTAAPPPPPTLSTRTKYIRTDAATEYFLSVNTHWEVYHRPTSRVFVTYPDSNRVSVVDSTTETQIGSILVPGAYAIDETPDQSTLYVGTTVGDVYTIDPQAMKVTQRFIASEIGPYGYQTNIALPLANGQVALLGEPGGIPSVDGSSSFAIWNPSDNSIKIFGGSA